MGQIKLKIDIKSGVIDIESEDTAFESVMDKAGVLLDKFSRLEAAQHSQGRARAESSADAKTDAEDDDAPETATGGAGSGPADKTKRRRSGSGGKTASWKMVDNLLNETQRQELKDFYKEKAPANQNEKVAVLAFKLKEATQREAFSGDEIYTAFQTVGEKTPKNLMAVFGNMTGAGLGNMADKKFKPNFKADDVVKHDLPHKAKK